MSPLKGRGDRWDFGVEEKKGKIAFDCEAQFITVVADIPPTKD